MEPAFRWAGNPNIVLGIKLLSLQITVQVRSTLLNKEMCGCVCFISFRSLTVLLSVGGFTNICSTTDNLETSCAYLSMLCKHCGIFHGEGEWNIMDTDFFLFFLSKCEWILLPFTYVELIRIFLV